jgi:phosphate transport system substrate-binding protein
MSGVASNVGRGGSGGKGPFDRLLGARWLIYAAILLILLMFRVVPGLRSAVKVPPSPPKTESRLILAGLDLAPGLIPRLTEEYRRLYPEVAFQVNGGGTRHALEDLINRRADVAFLSRPLTTEEEAVVRSVGDTAMSYPIALGGIAVLVAGQMSPESLSVDDLRRVIVGERPEHFRPAMESRLRLYAPDPNLGLWTALVAQLQIPDTARSSVYWAEDDLRVAAAVARDPQGLGFASMLALPTDLAPLGVQALPVVGQRTVPAAQPNQAAVAVGEYPLFHYLYVACRPDCGPTASGFVSFMHSGRGQRLIEREGFLPAREVPREIQLSSQPVTTAG